jgi:hypothetical protein
MGSRLGAVQHGSEDVEQGMRSCVRVILYDDPMTERQPLRLDVDCYAGHRGEQTPRTLILGGHRIDVAEVVDAWLAPEYRYFKLRGADGDTYLVRHDERSDTWELTMFRAERVDGP